MCSSFNLMNEVELPLFIFLLTLVRLLVFKIHLPRLAFFSVVMLYIVTYSVYSKIQCDFLHSLRISLFVKGTCLLQLFIRKRAG